ncbi:SDR family NAD(P)-dependent oxidoreductase [Pseudomonas syringae]|uniref:SDR family NAD(P)-dependent oxidoreductase n=1 Tax=Pseudomonas syringae TaxID=317 RepID=UPI003F76DA75
MTLLIVVSPIIGISSAGGRVARPGIAAFIAAKWAVSCFTEVLAIECASLGIKVIAIEPGGIGTDWGANAATQEITVMPDYQETVGATWWNRSRSSLRSQRCTADR